MRRSRFGDPAALICASRTGDPKSCDFAVRARDYGARRDIDYPRRRQFSGRLLCADAGMGGFAVCLTLRRFDWHIDELVFRGIERAADSIDFILLQFGRK